MDTNKLFDSVSELFSLIDRNGDGSLSRKELVRALATDDRVRQRVHSLPGLGEQLHPSRIHASIALMDEDGDSRVSLQEFHDFVLQLSEDHKYREMSKDVANTMRMETNSDSLPDIAKAAALKKWMRFNKRSKRIAIEFSRRRWLTLGLEAFCLAGWGVDMSTLELARLHRDEFDAKSEVLKTEQALKWPGGIESFRKAQKIKSAKLLALFFKKWLKYVSLAKSFDSTVPSIAYWAKYKRGLVDSLSQNARVYAVLSDHNNENDLLPDPWKPARRYRSLKPLRSKTASSRKFPNEGNRISTIGNTYRLVKRFPNRMSCGTLRLIQDMAFQSSIERLNLVTPSTKIAKTLRKAVSTGTL